MNVRIRRIVTLAAILLTAAWTVTASADLSDDAIGALAGEAAAGIASKVGVTTPVAVILFEGDTDNRISFRLVTELVERGVQVADKARVKLLIAEMKTSASGLYDQSQAPQWGRLLNAKVVVIGRLTAWAPGDHIASVSAEIKAVEVESSRIIWSGVPSSTRYSTTIIVIPLVILVLLVLSVGTRVLYKRRRTTVQAMMTGADPESKSLQAFGAKPSDQDIRASAGRAIDAAKAELSTAMRSLEGPDTRPQLKAIRDVSRDMDVLKRKIENATTGRPDTMSVAQAKDTVEFDRDLLERTGLVEQASREVADAAAGGDADAAEGAIGTLATAISRFNATFGHRDDERTGV